MQAEVVQEKRCGGEGRPPQLFLNIYFSWVEIRLHTKYQLPVLFGRTVIGLNLFQRGRGGPLWLFGQCRHDHQYVITF